MGITEETIIEISRSKQEPEWMLKKRQEAFKLFRRMKTPDWGPSLEELELDKINYFVKGGKTTKNWEEVPEDIKKTFDKLGIPEAEQKVLAGTGAQYESENIYHNLKQEWADKGVIFEDMDAAVHKHPMVKEHFMKCVTASLHKFAALHGAVWSGGTFIYIPPGVKVEMPMQAYFRMNSKRMGQFEHTLIIVDKDAEMHYIEGCSAPLHSEASLHAGCVEIIAKEGAKVRYSSVENWSKNTYNLNTKRALLHKNAKIEWIGGNLGSGVTMLYPCSILLEEGASADHLGIAFAGTEQEQDIGAKVYHLAPKTSSIINSKSISKDGGICRYRGIVKISKSAKGSKTSIRCDALMADNYSISDTIPYMEVDTKDAHVCHEARCGKISDEQLFYLTSRGLKEEEALQMIVSGFIEPISKELPVEYAVELNRMITMEMGK